MPRRQVFQIETWSFISADSCNAKKFWCFLLLFKLFKFEARGVRAAYFLDRALGASVTYMTENYLFASNIYLFIKYYSLNNVFVVGRRFVFWTNFFLYTAAEKRRSLKTINLFINNGFLDKQIAFFHNTDFFIGSIT